MAIYILILSDFSATKYLDFFQVANLPYRVYPTSSDQNDSFLLFHHDMCLLHWASRINDGPKWGNRKSHQLPDSSLKISKVSRIVQSIP